MTDGAARLEFEAAMGAVLTAAAKLEVVVALTAWGMAGLPQDIARIVVPPEVGIERMLRLISNLLDLRVSDDELRKATRGWVAAVRECNGERNRVAHSLWALLGGVEPLTHMRISIKAPSRQSQKKERSTPEDLRALAGSLTDLAGSDIPGALSEHVPGPWAITSISRRSDS